MRRKRRYVVAAAIVLAVVALLFLQLPGLDSWRFHTVATWRVPVPATLDSTLAPRSPAYALSGSVPARVHYAWSAGPAAYAAAAGDPASHQLLVNSRSTSVYSGPLFVAHWWPTPFLQRRGHEGGTDVADMASPSGTFYLVPPLYGHDGYRLTVWPYVAGSSLVVTISQPYAYYYLPLEDYLLLGLAVVAVAVVCARWLSRARRKRSVVAVGGQA